MCGVWRFHPQPDRSSRASPAPAPAVAFVEDLLSRRFRPRIDELSRSATPCRSTTTRTTARVSSPRRADLRRADWKVGPIPSDLWDRRVEITGPCDRKMIINALNSGASVFMADFEDATSPTWSRPYLTGQADLIDAVRRTITYENPATDRRYALNPEIATLMVRPRGISSARAPLRRRRAGRRRGCC